MRLEGSTSKAGKKLGSYTKKMGATIVVIALAITCFASVTGEKMREAGEYGRMIAVSSIYPREDPKLGMYLFPEAAYDDYYENCDTGVAKTHLSAVEEVSTGGDMTDDERKKIDNGSKEHKKPTLEIVE